MVVVDTSKNASVCQQCLLQCHEDQGAASLVVTGTKMMEGSGNSKGTINGDAHIKLHHLGEESA